MDQEKLLAALGMIAQKPEWRAEFIRQMQAFEKKIATRDIDIREDVTGPLIDALHDDDQMVRKVLADGTQLDFLYRSKIARDFVMSEPAQPDHAWEPQTSRLLVDLASRAKQVVIGGAYFGDQAILIARQAAKNHGTVHAFEPNNDQRRVLMHNAELNGLTNIVPRSEGLWDNSSTTLKLVGFDSFAHPEVAHAGSSDGFQTVTIQDYLKAAGVAQLDLIMLDIEGAELRALQGAQAYLERPAGEAPNIVFEVHRHYVDWSRGLENTDIVKLLTNVGYHVFAVRDFNSNYDLSSQPIELIPADAVYLEGPPHGFNMVAVKDGALFDSPRYRICKGVSPKLLRHKDPALHHPIGGL
ncbi:FkbM family methyltransferase [Noviherbaspirillum cavernae]|uniref:FkbM family methyltransferase n=1 Tax=Noviherbaspirillum cavernae TaxID=2320862 RepID=A0A418X654_9BURK|nr:FkbM family methyltransferase [Noviherbaspirillum cavernae]RJG07919.1 FkbM family methyltransferase [Noviherbaspirillum cavernae]